MMQRYCLLLLACALLLPAQGKKVLVLNGNAQLMEQLKSAAPSARIISVTRETTMAELPDADAFIGEITSEQVRAGKNLKWVGIMAAGVEKVLFPADGTADLRNSNIILTNNKIVQGPEIADHALAMLLALSRQLRRYIAADQQENWDGNRFGGIELNGKTAVVIGLGGIGMQIATRAWAFGMNVIGGDPEDKPFSPFVKRVVKPAQLDAVVP